MPSPEGRRGRGAFGKVTKFDLLKRGGQFYCHHTSRKDGSPATDHRGEVTTGQHCLYRLVQSLQNLDVNDFYRMRINHSERFAERGNLYQLDMPPGTQDHR
jgi:hypothetical protein